MRGTCRGGVKIIRADAAPIITLVDGEVGAAWRVDQRMVVRVGPDATHYCGLRSEFTLALMAGVERTSDPQRWRKFSVGANTRPSRDWRETH